MTTLVLLPGLHGSTVLFAPLLSALPRDVDVACVAYPPDASLDYAALTDLAEAQLPDHHCVVLGESFSGPVAFELARRRPGQVTGIIMAGSFVANPNPLILALVKHLPLAGLMRLPLPDLLIRLFALGMQADGALCDLARQAIRDTPRAVLAARVRMIANLEPPVCEPLPLPTLYLRGTHDVMVLPGAIEHCRRVLPQLTVERFACPHLTLQAKPHDTATAISAFMGYDR